VVCRSVETWAWATDISWGWRLIGILASDGNELILLIKGQAWSWTIGSQFMQGALGLKGLARNLSVPYLDREGRSTDLLGHLLGNALGDHGQLWQSGVVHNRKGTDKTRHGGQNKSSLHDWMTKTQ